ncbi:MAG: hypothetical protein HY517_03475 [Candidatus Aenigmarchaeota archaeon]|nr:hypothetical protein [Candidatus Aenigmarchaeota archaeon]
MTSESCYFFGKSIPPELRREMVDIHKIWQHFAFRDAEELDEKIDFYEDGISCMVYNGRPCGVAESLLICTEGRNEDIPRTEKELRARVDRKGNTRVLVTLTIREQDRKVRIGDTKLAHIYLRHILQYFHMFRDSYKPSDFLTTFSPDTPPAQITHDIHEACYMDDLLLLDARPGLVIEGIPAANVRPRGYRWKKNGSLYVSRWAQPAA